MIKWLKKISEYFKQTEPYVEINDVAHTDKKTEPSRTLFNINDDELYIQHSKILVGYKFVATLHFTTPLKILKHHGEIHEGTLSTAPKYGTEKDGIWIPQVKPEFDLLAKSDNEISSDIGLVNESEFLPFLINFREIYESDLEVSEKLIEIDKLSSKSCNKSIANIIKKTIPDFPHSVFYTELTQIDGLGKKLAGTLYKSGYTSINAIKNASDSELLQIKGIGKQTLRKIREAAP